MPELFERGHIYIAQPPLYKVKHGKSERYIKDEHELKEHLLKLALADAELFPGAEAAALSKDTLEQVAKQYFLAEAVIDRMGRLIDASVLQALLVNPEINLGDEQNAAQSAQRLTAALSAEDIRIEPKYDEKTERHLLVIKRTQHGNLHQTVLDEDFIHSGDYEQIKTTAHVLQGLLGEGAYVKRGEHKQPGS